LSEEPKQGSGKEPGKTEISSSQSKPKSNILLIAALSVVAVVAGLITWKLLFPSQVITSTGLKYTDEVVGTGASPMPGKIVKVHYTGRLENGVKFDSSVDRGEPLEFPIGVGRVIKGWDEGVMTMKVGGKRRLIIPPELGYGSRNLGVIPPNSTLIFDVELIEVK